MDEAMKASHFTEDPVVELRLNRVLLTGRLTERVLGQVVLGREEDFLVHLHKYGIGIAWPLAFECIISS